MALHQSAYLLELEIGTLAVKVQNDDKQHDYGLLVRIDYAFVLENYLAVAEVGLDRLDLEGVMVDGPFPLEI
jgi:hypothetical protein